MLVCTLSFLGGRSLAVQDSVFGFSLESTAFKLEAELFRRLDSRYDAGPLDDEVVVVAGVGLFLVEETWLIVADLGMRGGGGMPSCLSILETWRL